MSFNKILNMLEYEGNVCSCLHRVISGSEFNKIFETFTFVIMTDEEEYFNINNETNIKNGLNIVTMESDYEFKYTRKGIYFTNSDNASLCNWISYGKNIIKYIRKIIIPDDAQIVVCKYVFKADRLILCQREEINKEIYVKSVKKNCMSLKNVPIEFRDWRMCMEAIRHNDIVLQYIPSHLIDEICALNQQKKIVMQ